MTHPSALEGAWRLEYADGSGNRYELVAGEAGTVEVTYDPVTPAMSSTGFYSGGPPRHGVVTRDDPRLAELWELVGQATPATSTGRIKGTGALTIVTSEGTRELVLHRGPALAAIDALLATFGTTDGP